MLDLQAEFPQDPETCYLNHAAVAPWPARSAEAARRFADQCVRVGARHYPDWLREEQRLRQQLAQLIHAEHPLDVALLKNTSEGLSFIAAGLDWREGDNVIISNQEFPSNRIPWEALARHGVTVRDVLLVPAGSIPRTSSGKIARRACKAAYIEGTLRGGYQQNAFPDAELPD